LSMRASPVQPPALLMRNITRYGSVFRAPMDASSSPSTLHKQPATKQSTAWHSMTGVTQKGAHKHQDVCLIWLARLRLKYCSLPQLQGA
jgi:hypothetical protein